MIGRKCTHHGAAKLASGWEEEYSGKLIAAMRIEQIFDGKKRGITNS